MAVKWRQVNLGAVVDINPPRQLQRGHDSVYVAMEQIQPNSRSITENLGLKPRPLTKWRTAFYFIKLFYPQ